MLKWRGVILPEQTIGRLDGRQDHFSHSIVHQRLQLWLISGVDPFKTPGHRTLYTMHTGESAIGSDISRFGGPWRHCPGSRGNHQISGKVSIGRRPQQITQALCVICPGVLINQIDRAGLGVANSQVLITALFKKSINSEGRQSTIAKQNQHLGSSHSSRI